MPRRPLALAATACGSTSPNAPGVPSGSVAQTVTTSASVAPSSVPARAASTPNLQLTSTAVSVPIGNGGGAFSTARRLDVPRGWHVEVWARVATARFMTWTPQGSLLVSVPSAGQVVELTPRTNPAAPPLQRVLVTGLTNPQGLAFDHLNGQTVLYVAESDAIDRYKWQGSSVGARAVIVHGVPDTDPRGDDVHRSKALVVGADHRIYVNIGSAFKASPVDQAGNPPRASVVSFSSSGGDLRVEGTGIRNGEGLAFAPDGVLWTAINERDQIAFPSHSSFAGTADAYGQIIPSYVTNHPPDEIVPLTGGRDVGWPFCNPVANTDFTDMHLQADEQNNPGGGNLDCSHLQFDPARAARPQRASRLPLPYRHGNSPPRCGTARSSWPTARGTHSRHARPWSGGCHGRPPGTPSVRRSHWSAASRNPTAPAGAAASTPAPAPTGRSTSATTPLVRSTA